MAMSVTGEINIFTHGDSLEVEAVCTDGTPILKVSAGRWPGGVMMRIFTEDPKEMMSLGQAIIDQARALMTDKEDCDATAELASTI